MSAVVYRKKLDSCCELLSLD